MTDRYGRLSWAQIHAGFAFEGQIIHLATKAKGIFKPALMTSLLSIKTVVPKPGRRIWYEDQTPAHSKIFAGTETVDYDFRGTDWQNTDNLGLREAMERGLPLIYFLGVSPGFYEVIMPVYIFDWDAQRLKARLSFAQARDQVLDYSGPAAANERRYALTQVKHRLHQSVFREAVFQAYDGRCALSGLPEARLLDAAHIVPDVEELGHPIVPNGLPMSKIHHAAFDAHLIGVDSDGRIHVSSALRDQKDGAILEAIKSLHGSQIRQPSRPRDRPDPKLLELRFRRFMSAA